MEKNKYTLNHPSKNYHLCTFNLLLTHLLTYLFLCVLPKNNRVHLFLLVIYPLSFPYMSFSYNHHWISVLVRHLWPHFCCLTFSPLHSGQFFHIRFISFLHNQIMVKKLIPLTKERYMNKSLRLILLYTIVLLI